MAPLVQEALKITLTQNLLVLTLHEDKGRLKLRSNLCMTGERIAKYQAIVLEIQISVFSLGKAQAQLSPL